MKLSTIRLAETTAACIVDDAGHHPIPHPEGGHFADIGALLRAGASGDAAVKAAADSAAVSVEDADLLRPVLDPAAVLCVGLNYRSHILEMKREIPTVPTWFSKLSRSLTDPYADIAIPSYSDQLDYEAELGVVIGRGGRDIPESEAWEAVAGVTIVNDVTVRDWQWRTPQWFAGKAGQRLSPVGPSVVSLDELPGPLGELRLELSVNGEARQSSLLGDLVFDVPALIADISRVIDLEPGDIIATGTPGGVIAGTESRIWLRAGDVVATSIEGIGTLRNTIRPAG